MSKENRQNSEAHKWLQPIVRFLIEKVGVHSFLLSVSDVVQEQPLLTDTEIAVPDPLAKVKQTALARKEYRQVETMDESYVKEVVGEFLNSKEVDEILDIIMSSKVRYFLEIIDLGKMPRGEVKTSEDRIEKWHRLNKQEVTARYVWCRLHYGTKYNDYRVRLSVNSPDAGTTMPHTMELKINIGNDFYAHIKESVKIDLSNGFTLITLKKSLGQLVEKFRRYHGLTLG